MTAAAEGVLVASFAAGVIFLDASTHSHNSNTTSRTHCLRQQEEDHFQVDRYYKLSKVLGQGAYGKVYQAKRRRDGQTVALKIMHTGGTKSNDFDREIKALTILSAHGGHPHVCRLFDMHKDNDNYYLAMELISGGELFEHLIENGAYSEKDAAKFFKQNAEALAFMHSKDIVHGDLKPENLMMDSWDESKAKLKVVDFGSAVSAADETANDANITGTIAYLAPEMLYPRTRKIVPGIDVFATGVILYILLTGTHPFDPYGNASDDDLAKTIKAIKNVEGLKKKVFDSRTEGLSESCLELLEGLMHPDPKRRMTSQELLRHPWVQGVTASQKVIAGSDQKLALFWQRRFRAAVLRKYAAATNRQGSLSDYNLRDIFRSIDLDGSGDISLEELKVALSELLGDKNMAHVLKSVDIDDSGSIDFSEFATIMRKQFEDGEGVRVHLSRKFRAAILRRFKKAASNKSLREIFDAIDADGDGMLSIEELQAALRELGIDNEEVSAWVDCIDTDLNGGVDFDEFRNSMQPTVRGPK